IERAVFQPVRSLDLGGRLVIEERLAGSLPCGDLILRAVTQGDFLSRNEEYLSDGQVVRRGNRLARHQHVSKFSIVNVPVRLNADYHYGRRRPLDHIEDRCVDSVPTGWRL